MINAVSARNLEAKMIMMSKSGPNERKKKLFGSWNLSRNWLGRGEKKRKFQSGRIFVDKWLSNGNWLYSLLTQESKNKTRKEGWGQIMEF